MELEAFSGESYASSANHVVSVRALAGPSTSTFSRSLLTGPAGRNVRAPRAAMLTARLPTRSYAAEAGGKFSRKKPHFK